MDDAVHTMSDKFCSNSSYTCATLNRCPDLVDTLAPEIPETCGFDTKQNLLMVCCPAETVKEVADELVQKPRFYPNTCCHKIDPANISGFQPETGEQGNAKTEASNAADGRRRVAGWTSTFIQVESTPSASV